MNNPAAKEPSMDEILSSIRQIIADDDGEESSATAETEAKADIDAKAETDAIAEALASSNKDAVVATGEDATAETEDGALELTSEQIVSDDEIAFSPVEQKDSIVMKSPKEAEPEPEPDAVSEKAEEMMADLVVTDDISFDEEEEDMSAAELDVAAESSSATPSLPDPDLSANLAEKLLEPATESLVSSAFAKLGGLQFNNQELTVENMIREMLRPMLKEWLDENLPSIVEKTVRKEVERLSRGG